MILKLKFKESEAKVGIRY